MIAYHLLEVDPRDAKASPVFAPWHYAGPWGYASHPAGGTLAYWRDWPETGQHGGRTPDCYGEPEDCALGVRYLPPLQLPRLYDLAWSDRPGVEMTLACGLVITVPEALIAHRTFSLTGRDRKRPPSVDEYGRLAHELWQEVLDKPEGIPEGDPRLQRLVALAVGLRYRTTPELLEDLGVIALEDINPILGVVWCGDPKALLPAPGGAGTTSPSSDSPANP